MCIETVLIEKPREILPRNEAKQNPPNIYGKRSNNVLLILQLLLLFPTTTRVLRHRCGFWWMVHLAYALRLCQGDFFSKAAALERVPPRLLVCLVYYSNLDGLWFRSSRTDWWRHKTLMENDEMATTSTSTTTNTATATHEDDDGYQPWHPKETVQHTIKTTSHLFIHLFIRLFTRLFTSPSVHLLADTSSCLQIRLGECANAFIASLKMCQYCN